MQWYFLCRFVIAAFSIQAYAIHFSDARFVVSVRLVMVWEEVKVWYDDGIYGVGNEIIVAVAAIVAIVLVGYKLLSWAMPGDAPRNNANREHIGVPGEKVMVGQNDGKQVFRI